MAASITMSMVNFEAQDGSKKDPKNLKMKAFQARDHLRPPSRLDGLAGERLADLLNPEILLW
jgi:hypothetical protein